MGQDYKTIIERYGFSVRPRAEAPAMVRNRPYPGTWCLFDPLAGEDGFCLLGDDPEELAKECAEHHEIARDSGEAGAVSLPLLAFQAGCALGLASGVAAVVNWAQGVLGGLL